MAPGSEKEQLAAFRVLAAIAWADGQMAKEEALALRRIVDATFKGAEIRAIAERYVGEPIAFDLSGTESLGDDDKEGLFRAALQCVAADGKIDSAEEAMLKRLGAGLGISEDRVKQLKIEQLGERSTSA